MAAQGLYVGTSSWKYPGWCGNIYDEQRYLTRVNFPQGTIDLDSPEDCRVLAQVEWPGNAAR